MTIAGVFKSGNSQALRLPKEFPAQGAEDLPACGEIVLREPVEGLSRAFELLAGLPDDFLPEGRRDGQPHGPRLG